MNGKVDLNIDQKTLEACLKSINNIGGTVYQNICTGQEKFVPWGSADWLGVIFITGLVITLIWVLIYMIRN